MKEHGREDIALQEKAVLTAYELVIQDLAARCDYGRDSDAVALLDALEKRYTELREASPTREKEQ
jgi:hypothetical protein